MDPEETLREVMRALAQKRWADAHANAKTLRNYLRTHPDAHLCGMSGTGLRWTMSAIIVGVDLFAAEL